ncbi:unnamed protein product [Ixodes persulcatus]
MSSPTPLANDVTMQNGGTECHEAEEEKEKEQPVAEADNSCSSDGPPAKKAALQAFPLWKIIFLEIVYTRKAPTPRSTNSLFFTARNMAANWRL